MICKPFLLSILFILEVCISFSQYAKQTNDPYGSAKDLKGSTLVINCFITDTKHNWKLKDQMLILAKEAEGFEWLKKQAAIWKIYDLSFDTVSFQMGNTIRVPKIYTWQQAIEKKTVLLQDVFTAAGYNNINEFYDSVKKNSDADHIVMLLFADKDGRSYAQPTLSEIRNNRYFESALVFNATESNHDINYGTVMHEMLHLFGAWDMYHSETRNSEMEAKVNGVFKNSVMLNSHIESEYRCIDQLTAWRIGWTKTYFPWYEMFRLSSGKYWTELPH